jgi:hypothetical protein
MLTLAGARRRVVPRCSSDLQRAASTRHQIVPVVMNVAPSASKGQRLRGARAPSREDFTCGSGPSRLERLANDSRDGL